MEIKKKWYGWLIQPITFEGKKYVVEILQHATTGAVIIYQYSKEKHFLSGHEGKKVFQYETNTNDSPWICMYSHDIESNTEEIVTEIFMKFKFQLEQDKEKQRKIEASKEWNGVVKLPE